MNRILKRILLTAKDVALDAASEAVPGSGVLISGVQKLLDKDDTNNSAAIAELESGTVAAISALKGADVLDAALLAEGITEIEAGFKKIKKSVH